MYDPHKNFIITTVATAPSPATSGTSLIVSAGYGASLPATPFNLTVWPADAQPLASNAEVVRVTAISTDTLTIIRAQEGTTARSIQVGDQIAMTITAKALQDIETSAMTKAVYDPQNAGHISGAGGGGGGTGGVLSMEAGAGTSANGGSINTAGGSSAGSAGGSINTSNGGGTVDTRGTGSIQMGVAATRTTITGGATAPRSQVLPNKDGTFAMMSDLQVKACVKFNGTAGGATNTAATYGRTLTTVTITLVNHGYLVGHMIYADFITGGALDGLYAVVSVVNANSFTITTAASGTIAPGSTMQIQGRNMAYSRGVHSVTPHTSGAAFYINLSMAESDANYHVDCKASFVNNAYQAFPHVVENPSTVRFAVSTYTFAGAAAASATTSAAVLR